MINLGKYPNGGSAADTPDHEKAAPFIYINGHAGVGKLSVAQKLVPFLGQPAKLLDNHLLIDPVAALLERTSKEYQPLRKLVRDTILSAIVNSNELKGTIIIFTDSQSSNTEGSSVAKEYEEAAKSRGSQFLSFRLECDEDEYLRRAMSEDRKQSRATKLTDEKIIRQLRQ